MRVWAVLHIVTGVCQRQRVLLQKAGQSEDPPWSWSAGGVFEQAMEGCMYMIVSSRHQIAAPSTYGASVEMVLAKTYWYLGNLTLLPVLV